MRLAYAYGCRLLLLAIVAAALASACYYLAPPRLRPDVRQGVPMRPGETRGPSLEEVIDRMNEQPRRDVIGDDE